MRRSQNWLNGEGRGPPLSPVTYVNRFTMSARSTMQTCRQRDGLVGAPSTACKASPAPGSSLPTLRFVRPTGKEPLKHFRWVSAAATCSVRKGTP